jgi:hypothetical protein
LIARQRHDWYAARVQGAPVAELELDPLERVRRLTPPGCSGVLKTLVAHSVQFVVIGGAGIQSHGRRYDTLDIGLTPDRDEANLHRLADALNELDCRFVSDPANSAAWVPTPTRLLHSLQSPRRHRLDTGDATRAARPRVPPERLPWRLQRTRARAEHLTVASTRIALLVAALDDIHKSKRAADRPKDRAYFLAAGETGRD